MEIHTCMTTGVELEGHFIISADAHKTALVLMQIVLYNFHLTNMASGPGVLLKI